MTRTRAHERLDELRATMVALGLHDMAAQFEREMQGEPDPAETRLDFLARLLEAQRRARQQRSIERRIKAAGFPASRSLDDFDFVFQTGVKREWVMQLATLDFLRQRKSLLIAGMSGTGKSHIAISLGHLACAAGYSVLYTSSARMLGALHLAYATGSLHKGLRPYLRCELLIIDEVGLDRPERQSTRLDDASLFYKVVAGRYEGARATVITSNIEWKDWGAYLGDEVASVAILDRLAHHSYALNIIGPSWRAEEHKRLNAGLDTTP